MIHVLILAIGFVLLIKGAGWLVDGASALARSLGISHLVIGLTVVAFGTSFPELFVNISASAHNNPAIAIGNILGSNIANILLILGICAMIYPLKVASSTTWKEIPFTLLAAVLVLLLVQDERWRGGSPVLGRTDGMILLVFFGFFLYYIFHLAKADRREEPGQRCDLPPTIGRILLGLAGLVAGGELVVRGAVQLAARFGLSESLVGLTIVAVGTSLPELATSAVAAYKKHSDIAVGNIVGSNIFNIFFILGISAVIRPLPFHAENQVDTLVTIAASLVLFLCLFVGIKRVLGRWEGVLFLVLYAAYIVFLIRTRVG